jgi:hypothetical protein
VTDGDGDGDRDGDREPEPRARLLRDDPEGLAEVQAKLQALGVPTVDLDQRIEELEALMVLREARSWRYLVSRPAGKASLLDEQAARWREDAYRHGKASRQAAYEAVPAALERTAPDDETRAKVHRLFNGAVATSA